MRSVLVFCQADPCANDVSGDWVLLSVNRNFRNTGQCLDDAFDLRGIDLLPTHVDDFRGTPQEAQVISLDLDRISRIQPAVFAKRAWGIQISQHRGTRPDL